MKLSRQIDFDMGHCVTTQCGSDGLSPCLMPHGHRFTLIVTVEGNSLPDSEKNGGMVIDFREVKKLLMKEIHNVYDHSFAIWEKDPAAGLFEQMKTIKPYADKIHLLPYVPTSENFVEHWFPILKEKFENLNIKLYSIELFETPNCSCLYTLEDFNAAV